MPNALKLTKDLIFVSRKVRIDGGTLHFYLALQGHLNINNVLKNKYGYFGNI
jgi:hypothetical protein